MDSALSWTMHIEYLCNKVQQRIYFLRRLRSFGASKIILHQFYVATVQSVLLYECPVWFCGLLVQLKSRSQRLLNTCSKIVGHPVDNTFTEMWRKQTLRLADKISTDSDHVLHNEFELLPSGRRFRVPRCRGNRYKHSFVPSSITLMNNKS